MEEIKLWVFSSIKGWNMLQHVIFLNNIVSPENRVKVLLKENSKQIDFYIWTPKPLEHDVTVK